MTGNTIRIRKNPEMNTQTDPMLPSPVLKTTVESKSVWKKFLTRFFYGCIMITAFIVILKLGPAYISLLVFALTIGCLNEITKIAHAKYSLCEITWYKWLHWYFILLSLYYFVGEVLLNHFEEVMREIEVVRDLSSYHRFISYSLYCTGLMLFVLTLHKSQYRLQFSLFAWTHLTILFLVTQGSIAIHTLLDGVYWFIYPACMVICNDIMAYMFGVVFGKTPLIRLSPKKTWEGFVGGFVATMLFGLLLSKVLYNFPNIICPSELTPDFGIRVSTCEPSYVFNKQSYEVFPLISDVSSFFGVPITHIRFRPIYLHGMVFAMFASLVAPFGGFFCSGLKRAFGLKDFGDLIPGHGGIIDRFDCHIFNQLFVFVYYQSFIKSSSPSTLLRLIDHLAPDSQVRFYEVLRQSLQERQLLV